jgi:hypothetical protein
MRSVASGSVDGKSSRGGYRRLTMLGRSELRRGVLVVESMGKVEPFSIGYCQIWTRT